MVSTHGFVFFSGALVKATLPSALSMSDPIMDQCPRCPCPVDIVHRIHEWERLCGLGGKKKMELKKKECADGRTTKQGKIRLLSQGTLCYSASQSNVFGALEL